MLTVKNYGVIQVTGTASSASLQSLMNTATAGSGDKALADKVNYIMLSFEGTARFSIDGSTVTASTGLQGAATTNASSSYRWETSVDKIMIIGNGIKINVQFASKSQD